MDIRTTLFGGASNLFGEPTADAVFSAGLSTSVQANELIVTGLQRDLDRLNGYNVDLSPSRKQELEDLQAQIGRINERAGPDGVLTDSDAIERTELYQDAYKILGKNYVDVKKDDKLTSLMQQVDDLLEPKLRGAAKARLERLRNMETHLLGTYEKGSTSRTTVRQIQNLQVQISNLTPPNKLSSLSNTERADYNALVNEINERAGTDLLLNSRDRLKAEQIQASIDRFGG